MRALVTRQRTVRTAAVAASLALLTACTAQPGSTPDGAGGLGDAVGAIGTVAAGALVVSDGTAVVRIGDRSITFPTTVTDAAVSPDGSRITYVDGDGNVSVSKLDGSGRLVLTKTTAGVVRSRPTWQSATIVFAEKRADNSSVLVGVEANGCDLGDGPALRDVPMDTGDNTSYVDLAPSSGDRVGRGWKFAFQHNEASGPEIWVDDTTVRGYFNEKVVDGTEPAMSPDGTKLAYVGPNGQIQVIARFYEPAPAQVTFGADKPSRLTWTPDGSRIAYRTPDDIESVAAEVTPGATTNPATVLADKPGVPTFVRPRMENVYRINGADPVALAIAAAQSYWPAVAKPFRSQGFSGAYAVALTAPGSAATAISSVRSYDTAMLLTPTDKLDPRTLAELERMFGDFRSVPDKPTVKIIGGPDVVSAAVENDLLARGFAVTRAASTDGLPPVSQAADPCSRQRGGALALQNLVIVNAGSATDLAIAEALARYREAAVLRVDPAAGLSDAAKEWLARSSAGLNTTYLVDPDGTGIPAALEKEIATLVTGPLGYDTGANPTVKPLT